MSEQEAIMPISIAPTNLLPLGDEPTRIVVRVCQDLFQFIDPSMDPLVEGDSFSRVSRKGAAAMNQMTREVSTVLFGAEVPTLRIRFGWPKYVKGVERKPWYTGVCFNHNVAAGDLSPRVLELTADEKVDGTVVFHAAELDANRKDFINEHVAQIHEDEPQKQAD